MRFLSWMTSGEACIGVRMEYFRFWEPSTHKPKNPGPIGPVRLTPASECPSPVPLPPLAEYLQSLHISRDRVVVEVALNDRLEPFARLLDRIVHAFAELLLDLLQFGPHTLGDRLGLLGEISPSVLS